MVSLLILDVSDYALLMSGAYAEHSITSLPLEEGMRSKVALNHSR